jgi:hypothetical protein
VDVFGTLTLTGSWASLANGGTLNLHPGASLTMAYVLSGGTNRLADASPLALDGSTLALTGSIRWHAV